MKKITQKKLNKILELYQKCLDKITGRVRADLKRYDLSGADLKYLDLSGVNLKYLDLSGVHLKGADLENVKANEITSFFALQRPEE